MKQLYFIFLISVLCLSCKDAGADLPGGDVEDDVKEAVFRYQLTNASLDMIYFLELTSYDPASKTLSRYDPTDAFMARFVGLAQTIKKYSDCNTSFNGTTDKVTGLKGIILRVDGIRWLSTTEANVDGGYSEDGLSASGNIYTVKFISGKWVITNNQLIWIAELLGGLTSRSS